MDGLRFCRAYNMTSKQSVLLLSRVFDIIPDILDSFSRVILHRELRLLLGYCFRFCFFPPRDAKVNAANCDQLKI